MYIRQVCLAVSAGCFSLVAGMAPAEQNGGDFIGYGTFFFIDNSENIMAIISNFHCFRKGIYRYVELLNCSLYLLGVIAFYS